MQAPTLVAVTAAQRRSERLNSIQMASARRMGLLFSPASCKFLSSVLQACVLRRFVLTDNPRIPQRGSLPRSLIGSDELSTPRRSIGCA